MPGVATLFGRLGPGRLGLGEVLLAVQGHEVADRRPTQRQLDFTDRQERVVVAVEDVLVLQPEPHVHEPTGGDAQREPGRRAGRARFASGCCPGGRNRFLSGFVLTAGGRATGRHGHWSSPQTETISFSRHRCASSAAAITSPTTEKSGPWGIPSDDHRGTAWLATREFDTQPSTFTPISSGAMITPLGPASRSR